MADWVYFECEHLRIYTFTIANWEFFLSRNYTGNEVTETLYDNKLVASIMERHRPVIMSSKSKN